MKDIKKEVKERTFKREEVGILVKNLRTKNQMTPKQLAFMLNIDLPEVHKLEKGERGLTIEYLIGLSRIFKCDVNEIVFSQNYISSLDKKKNKINEVIEICKYLKNSEIDFVIEFSRAFSELKSKKIKN